MDPIDDLKNHLAANARPHVHDAAVNLFRAAIDATSGEAFSPNAQWTDAAFRDRVAAYDAAFGDCARAQAMLAWWGDPRLRGTLTLGPKRICETIPSGGHGHWLALSWYPVALVLYAGGIAAVAAERFDNLFALLNARVMLPDHFRARARGTLMVNLVENLQDVSPQFGLLEGRKNRLASFSEHLRSVLRPCFDTTLGLGSEFERAFHCFEVLLALERLHRAEDGWSPYGLFWWKGHDPQSSPLHIMLEEAAEQGQAWPPLAAGLCGRSPERVSRLGAELTGMISRQGRW